MIVFEKSIFSHEIRAFFTLKKQYKYFFEKITKNLKNLKFNIYSYFLMLKSIKNKVMAIKISKYKNKLFQ